MDSEPRAAKQHGRNASQNRVDLPRRSTRDPLQTDDGLPAAPRTPQPEAPTPPPRSLASTPARNSSETEPDFSFLLRPENFHPIPMQDVPPPFRRPPPDPSVPISTLLEKGNFRAAAHSSALKLLADPSPPRDEIFNLLYTRLSCLTLLGHITMAAQESRCLRDLGGAVWTPGPDRSILGNILPWELRVLATRLQAIGTGELRRAIPGYYDLARAARAHVRAAADDAEKDVWSTRLFDIGTRVANVLVELGDLAGAVKHLESLDMSEVPQKQRSLVRGRLGLVYLRLGRLADARRFIAGDEATGHYSEVLRPLLSIAESNHSSAAKQLEVSGDDTLTKNNLAVALVYAGEMKKAREILESMVQEGQNFPVLLFNLSTIFELCTERSKMLKAELVEDVAKIDGDLSGWERSMQDFKL